MPILGQMSTNPAELAKQVQSFKQEKAAFDQSHREWLKGRDIQKVELDAKQILENAKIEAERIKQEASEYVNAAQKDKEKCHELKAKAEGALQSAINRENDADTLCLKYQHAEKVAKEAQEAAQMLMQQAQMIRKEYEDKIQALKQFLDSI